MDGAARKTPPAAASLEAELAQAEPAADLGPPAERRLHARVPVELPVRLSFGSLQEFIGAHAEDLSTGGLLLRGAAAAPGQIVRLELDAGGERILRGTGKVVRQVPPKAPGGLSGVGIQFVELDARSRALIAAIVEARLAEPSGD